MENQDSNKNDNMSWMGLVWRIVSNVKLLIILVVLILATYFILKFSGVDIIALLLNKGIETQKEIKVEQVVDISGSWYYRCTSLGKAFDHGGYEHGGIVTFQKITTPYGEKLKIVGQRQWHTVRGNKGRDKKIKLEIPINWTTDTGQYTSRTSIEYVYNTTLKNGSYEGYSKADILLDEYGNPTKLIGTFQYRIPSEIALRGNLEFVKISTINPFF